MSRIEVEIEKYRKTKQKPVNLDSEIDNARTLIGQAMGAISVIGREGASEKQLARFEEIGAKMNHAVRF